MFLLGNCENFFLFINTSFNRFKFDVTFKMISVISESVESFAVNGEIAAFFQKKKKLEIKILHLI